MPGEATVGVYPGGGGRGGVSIYDCNPYKLNSSP